MVLSEMEKKKGRLKGVGEEGKRKTKGKHKGNFCQSWNSETREGKKRKTISGNVKGEIASVLE